QPSDLRAEPVRKLIKLLRNFQAQIQIVVCFDSRGFFICIYRVNNIFWVGHRLSVIFSRGFLIHISGTIANARGGWIFYLYLQGKY
ncbi:MAG: hypothetical protein K5866_00135, partial [Treponema sp.]|nr:hypothetical protein [Treponema sp.]